MGRRVSLFLIFVLGLCGRAWTDGTAVESETLPDGTIRDTWTLESPSMGRGIRVAVVRPPGTSEQEVPVLYALHGYGAPYLAFTEMAPMRNFLLDHPMLLVVFDGDKDSSYIDATHRKQSKFTTFFFDELVPEINKRYRTNGKMAVTGFSMGGYGAMHYLLTRPEAFTSVSSLSGAFQLTTNEKWIPWMEGLLGPRTDNVAGYESVDVMGRFETLAGEGQTFPPILLICGTEDHLLSQNRDLVDCFSKLNQAVAPPEPSDKRPGTKEAYLISFESREAPGAHDWKFWKNHSAEIARFHWDAFQ